MQLRCYAIALGAAALLLSPGCRTTAARLERAAAAPRHVVLIVVDGLDAREVDAEHTPTLAHYWQASAWCPGARGRAAMPARTNVNHATLLTGVHPEIHGVTGNAFWDRTREPPRKLGAAADLLTETLFTVAARTRPALRTAAAVGKGKLALMFAASASGQAAPGATWSPGKAPSADRDPVTSYAYDAATLRGARTIFEGDPVDFMVVNLADVDRVSHGAGPRSTEAVGTRWATDGLIGDFLLFLLGREEWGQTTVVITADHGFDTISHPPIDFAALARGAGIGGLVSVGDGGVGHVYVRDPASSPPVPLLAAARRLALATPGIVEALYLRENGGDGGTVHTLAAVHPGWHLAHERSGDLLLVGGAGYVLTNADRDEARLRGNHGGPTDLDVPVIVVQGSVVRDDSAPAGESCEDLTAADLGRSLIACLGLRDVERLDGAAIPADGRGRLLRSLCP